MEIISWDAAQNLLTIKKDNVVYRAKVISYNNESDTYYLYVFNTNEVIPLKSRDNSFAQEMQEKSETFSNNIVAPISGRVTEIHVEVGQHVQQNDPLVTIESMKMENEIRAPFGLFVKSIPITKDLLVKKDEVLVNVERSEQGEQTNGTKKV